MAYDRVALRDQLIQHEGLRTKAYVDTVGKLTIGVGRNLTDVGISDAEAFILLDHDIDRTVAALQKALPWVNTLDEVRQRVLIDMAFNLGVGGLVLFKRFLTALLADDYETAAREMLQSTWAGQVGQRAVDLAQMMRVGTPVPKGTLRV